MTMAPIELLEPRWRDFWTRAGAVGDPAPIYEDLVTRYGEPHRAYHTLVHIAQCLQEFESARFLAADPIAVELSLWYPRRARGRNPSVVTDRPCRGCAAGRAALRAPRGTREAGRRWSDAIRPHRS